MFDIITIGGATRDIIFCTENGKIIKTSDPLCQKLLGFEYGAKLAIKNAHFTFGGGAQNIAIAFSRLGLKTAIISRIGNDDNGKLILENLKKEKVNFKFVQIDSKFPSGLSLFICGEKAKDHLAFCYRGANDHLTFSNSSLISDSKWLYLSSLSGKWQEILKEITKILESKNSKLKLAWNPGQAQLKAGIFKLKKILDFTEVLFLNKDEAMELVQSSFSKNSRKMEKEKLSYIKYLLIFLKHRGPKKVIITQGKKGAWFYDGKKFYFHQSSGQKPVETTGAGDAFGSGFVAGLIIYDDNIKKALDLAIKNSGSVVQKYGAEQGLLFRKQI